MRRWSWPGTRDFLRNRVARVWPAHVVTLHVDLAMAAALGLLGTGEGGHRRTPEAYAENLLMVQNWFQDRPSFNAPAWSIASEWFAYLLAPLLFLLLARARRPLPLAGLAALSYAAMLAVFAAYALPNGNLEHMFYVRILGEFVAGAALALLWTRAGVGLGRLAGPVALALLVVCAAVPAAAGGDYWAAPALGLLVAAVASSRGLLARVLSHRVLVAAGEGSYCLYLTHYLLRFVVGDLREWGVASGPRAAAAAVGVVVVLGAAAWLLHRLVEVPARRLLRAPSRTAARRVPVAEPA